MRAGCFDKFEGHDLTAILRQELLALPGHLIGEFRGLADSSWLRGKQAGRGRGKKQKLM